MDYPIKLSMTALAAMVLAGSAVAQQSGPPTGWGVRVDGLAAYQGSTDIDGGGSFSANRAFLRVGGLYRMQGGTSAGLAVSVGRLDYDFDVPGVDPWAGINDLRISAPIGFAVGQRARAFVSPSVRWDYQDGASSSDGMTWGAFGGVAWQINDRLRLGPAIGAFTQIEDDELDVFPALLVDWQISDRLSLSTGQAAGATQGPGLSLGYALSDTMSLSLASRWENIRFRLDDEGIAPGGVGQDRSVPVVLTLDWEPQPYISGSIFAGAEFNGQLQLEDTNGETISEQDYDTAPVAGFAFGLRF